MPFTIPGADTATYAKQAEPAPADFRILSDGSGDTGVIFGCLVPSSASLVIAVPTGSVRVAGKVITVAGNSITLNANATNPRLVLVSVPATGIVTITNGVAAANPFAPDVPAASVALALIYLPAAATAVAATQIIDKRVILIPARSYFDAVVDYGATGNGTTDDAAALQAAINAAGTAKRPLVIPPGTYKLGTDLSVPSNVTIFGYGATLENWTPELDTFGSIFRLLSETTTAVANVVIEGLRLNGRKASFASVTEQKHGVRIQGNVQNVRLRNLLCYDNKGDGILLVKVTGGSATLYPLDISIEDCVCVTNHRGGLAIAAGRHVRVLGGRYNDSIGTAPEFGIDIEPDESASPCRDILIDGAEMSGNNGAGLLIDYVATGSHPVRDVTVRGCAIFSNVGAAGGVQIQGGTNIVIDRCTIRNNTSRAATLTNSTGGFGIVDLTFRDNYIHNNGYGLFGIFGNSGTSRGLKFIGNTIIDNGGQGIQIGQGASTNPIDDVLIMGNTISNRSTALSEIGVYTQGAFVTRVRVLDNNLDGNTTSATSLADATASRIVADNQGVANYPVAGGASTTQTGVMTFVVDGGGAAITTGIKGDIYFSFACTITIWQILLDQSGSITFNIWKDTYALYPPTVADAITGTAKPIVSAAVKGQSNILTGWTTAIAADQTLRINVDSATTVTRATLALTYTRTV